MTVNVHLLSTQAHAEPLLSHEVVLAAAIRRYERLWLPLLAAHGRDGGDGAGLAAPLDVAWVWWCHSLAPHPYRKVRCACIAGAAVYAEAAGVRR